MGHNGRTLREDLMECGVKGNFYASARVPDLVYTIIAIDGGRPPITRTKNYHVDGETRDDVHQRWDIHDLLEDRRVKKPDKLQKD